MPDTVSPLQLVVAYHFVVALYAVPLDEQSLLGDIIALHPGAWQTVRNHNVATPRMNDTSDTTAEGLEKIINELGEGVVLLNADGGIEWANEAALALHDCHTPDQLGATVADYEQRFQPCDDNGSPLDSKRSPMARLLAGESVNEALFALPRASDGHGRRILSASGLTLGDGVAGGPQRALVLTDVTATREAEDRFTRAFMANPAPALILRLHDSRFIQVNPGFLEMTGYNRDDIIDKPWRDLDLLHDAEQRDTAIRALDTQQPFDRQESAVDTRNGHAKSVLVAGQPIELGGDSCMLFTFTDLDHRKQIATQLRETEKGLDKAFRMASVPMLACRQQSLDIIAINDAFATTTGCNTEDAAGRSLKGIGLDPDRQTLRELAELRVHGDSIRNREIQWQTRDGDTFNGMLWAEPVIFHDEASLLMEVLDITERKRSEADLAAAIDAVMQDTSWFTHTLMEKLAHVRQPQSHPGELDRLTAREKEILQRMCQGQTNKRIATTLQLSDNTVRNHVANLYSKLGVNDRSSAVVWGRERGLGNY